MMAGEAELGPAVLTGEPPSATWVCTVNVPLAPLISPATRAEDVYWAVKGPLVAYVCATEYCVTVYAAPMLSTPVPIVAPVLVVSPAASPKVSCVEPMLALLHAATTTKTTVRGALTGSGTVQLMVPYRK